MFKRLLTYTQYILPQRILSALMGKLAESRKPWLKNYLIQRFIHKYQVDLQDALIEEAKDYPSFNDFFIRQLKPSSRPIAPDELAIASPVDGTIAQLGSIHRDQLFQAKGFYFSLETLLGNDAKIAQLFTDGSFATLYLAPHNYHRVHMPIAGKLIQTIYIPGKLFSVNRMTSELIPNLYTRNERLIAIFETKIGPIAVILVGAMIVGHIQTAWSDHPIRTNHIHVKQFNDGVYLEKGAELGNFKLGSTVILLFPSQTIEWSPPLKPNTSIKFGQFLGKITS